MTKTDKRVWTQDDIPDELKYLRNIKEIQERDFQVLLEKDIGQYRGSWKKRGGIGAYFTFVRKIDSLTSQCDAGGYSIFKLCVEGGSGDGGTLEQVRDLRRYLFLVEAELMQRAYDEGGRYKVILEGYPGMERPKHLPSKLFQEPQEAAKQGALVGGTTPPELPPLMVRNHALAYADIYYYNSNFGMYTMRVDIPYSVYLKLPNELQAAYAGPIQTPADYDLNSKVYLSTDSIHAINKFKDFLGTNNKSS